MTSGLTFGENNRHHKFYYGNKLQSVVSQEEFWNQATNRELKINGAKKEGYGSNVDAQKVDQMRMFLHHRGASRSSSRPGEPVRGVPQPKLTQRTKKGDMTGRSARYSECTRATGWDSHASTGSTVLLRELLASNMELKNEFGSLKNEMIRMQDGIANIETTSSRTGRSRRPGGDGDVVPERI